MCEYDFTPNIISDDNDFVLNTQKAMTWANGDKNLIMTWL